MKFRELLPVEFFLISGEIIARNFKIFRLRNFRYRKQQIILVLFTEHEAFHSFVFLTTFLYLTGADCPGIFKCFCLILRERLGAKRCAHFHFTAAGILIFSIGAVARLMGIFMSFTYRTC